MSRNYAEDFPLLRRSARDGQTLHYLDNAATTQKPDCVLRAITEYYETANANPHRGAYPLSERATEKYEGARARVARFINAKSASEIVFTKNATEALNLAAFSFGINAVGLGDEIVLSVAEHHSNLIPWQRVARQKGAVLRYLYPDQNGVLTGAELAAKITPRTKIVAVAQVSNVLGVINPVRELVCKAHAVGAAVVLDAAQSIPHMAVDVQALGVDFAAFSAHKLYGPMGIGVLYAKQERLDAMRPLQFGGGMVESVSEQDTVLAEGPQRFEAGTPNAADAAGLCAALDYVEAVGYPEIARVEDELTAYALRRFSELRGAVLYGAGAQRTGILSFNMEGAHPHDVATILAADGVAVRAGHHCAHPLMRFLGVGATCRASFGLYNTTRDVDALIDALKKVREVLRLEA